MSWEDEWGTGLRGIGGRQGEEGWNDVNRGNGYQFSRRDLRKGRIWPSRRGWLFAMLEASLPSSSSSSSLLRGQTLMLGQGDAQHSQPNPSRARSSTTYHAG